MSRPPSLSQRRRRDVLLGVGVSPRTRPQHSLSRGAAFHSLVEAPRFSVLKQGMRKECRALALGALLHINSCKLHETLLRFSVDGSIVCTTQPNRVHATQP
jgi:hypothetical protein